MQERSVEAALYQEAIHKLSNHFQNNPDGDFFGDNIWDPYAEEFARTATPEEVDTFIDSFPDVYKEGPRQDRKFTYANTIRAYGAVAIYANRDNPELTGHSLEKIGRLEARADYRHQQHELDSRTGRFLVGLYNSLFLGRDTLNIARKYATKEGAYDPATHIWNLAHLASLQKDVELTNDSLSKTWRMCVEARRAQDALSDTLLDHNHSSQADMVIAFSVQRLYPRFPERMEAYCKANGLYLELIESRQAQGLTVPDEYFRCANKTVKAKGSVLFAARLAGAYLTNNEEHKAAKLIGNFSGGSRKYFKELLWRKCAIHSAEIGNYKAAFGHAAKIKDNVDSMGAQNDILQVLIENGDPALYYNTLNTYGSRYRRGTTHAEYTAPMCIKKGDIAGALDLIEREDKDHQALGWIAFTREYIAHEIDNGRGEALNTDAIIAYIENVRDTDRPNDLSFTYGQAYSQLRSAGLIDQANELRIHTQSLRPKEASAFEDHIRQDVTADLIKSKNWLEAMHGDHLANPDDGLHRVKELLLIAGGIHRERMQRKENQSRVEALTA